MQPKRDEENGFLFCLTVIACLFTLSALATFACGAEGKGGVYPLMTQSGNGSCVAIKTPTDDRQYFLTIEHVLDGGEMITRIDGHTYTVEPVELWESPLDGIALVRTVIRIPRSTKIGTYKIAKSSARRGDKVWAVGWPADRTGRQRYVDLKTNVKEIQAAHDGYVVTGGVITEGASGGALINPRGEIVGIISSIDRSRNVTLCSSVVGATKRFRSTQKVQWQCTPQNCYPIYQRGRYRIRERGSVGLLGGYSERIIEQQPSVPEVTRPPPQPTPQPQPAAVDYDRLAGVFMDRYGSQLQGEDGLPGRDGRDGSDGAVGPPGSTPDLDLDKLAEVITTRYADRLRGERGVAGPPGERGLIGVPDEDELAAVVDLWVERNMDKIEAFIDARNGGDNKALLRRIEALEQRPQQVLIVDGEAGNVLDDETYKPGEPIVLDIRRLLESAK